MRAADSSELDLRISRKANIAKIVINAIQKDGRFRNRLDARVRVVQPDQSVSDISLQQIAPGSYEAQFPLNDKGSYLFRVVSENGGPSKTLVYSYPDEFHFYPPHTEFLRAFSSETQGKFQPDAGDIFDPRGEAVSIPTRLWPYLGTLALLLYVADVFLRRVRLFE
jgi:hypothetical protein